MSHRITLCHEWVTTFGGSEQTARRLADALEVTDVYTFAAEPALVARLFPEQRVHSSRVGSSSFATRRWQWLLPLMARWWKQLDLRGFDCVVTSSHATVNSVQTPADVPHVSYCYAPMRYAWRWHDELNRVPALFRLAWPVVAWALRRSDRRRASNVDLFIAISRNVARRIENAYGRRSIVAYPPADTDFFSPSPTTRREDFFLLAGRLVAYKRPEMAVRAANSAGLPLVVAGSGPELPRLRRLAGSTIEFNPQPSDEDLKDLYRRARALVFPGVEDFGIVLVEAQACGTPVIALAEGGALESVIDGVTGVLYADPSAEELANRMLSFDESSYDREAIRQNALRFSARRFDAEIRRIVSSVLNASPGERIGAIERLLDASIS